MDQPLVKNLFIYDPAAGALRWRKPNGTRGVKGRTAGTLNRNGYINIKIAGRVYKAHRLIFLYVHGYMPDEVGHDNQQKTDNRIENLRDIKHQENMVNKKKYKNNPSGVTGVTWHKACKRWQSSIRSRDHQFHLGYFVDWFDAVCVRKSAEIQLGFHKLHGGD